jgi:hypothetical protein
MVALVYAKYLSEDPRCTVVRKSQVIAHSVKDPADSLSWGFRRVCNAQYQLGSQEP